MYFGYVFSIRDDFKLDFLKINMNLVWGSFELFVILLKMLISIIISKKEGKYLDFGYDVEDKFY